MVKWEHVPEGFPLEGKLSAEQTDEVSPPRICSYSVRKMTFLSLLSRFFALGSTSSASHEAPSPRGEGFESPRVESANKSSFTYEEKYGYSGEKLKNYSERYDFEQLK